MSPQSKNYMLLHLESLIKKTHNCSVVNHAPADRREVVNAFWSQKRFWISRGNECRLSYSGLWWMLTLIVTLKASTGLLGRKRVKQIETYSNFLVLMTTQSSLQYSFTFTQSHTHPYSASISSTLLFYEAQFRVQHLAQGHLSMQIFLGRLGIKLPTFRLEDDRSRPNCRSCNSHEYDFITCTWQCDKSRYKVLRGSTV